MPSTTLLIVGAGPFGLSTAGQCIARGVPHIVLGDPLSFWRDSMPNGMLLRSSYDWHLCAEGKFSFEAYLQDVALEAAKPIPLNRFLEYGGWYIRKRGVQVHETLASQINAAEPGSGFVVTTDAGEKIDAQYVLCTPGLSYFRNVPERITELVAPEHWVHSAEISDPTSFAGTRCLIIGGRQSAFELAALLAEHGAQSVTVVLRHSMPQFTESDWSWVGDDLRASELSPGWFSCLPEERRTAIGRRFWEEGRLRLEPWLAPRIQRHGVQVIPQSEIESVCALHGGGYRGRLSGTATCDVEFDRLILATGFSVDLSRVPYLKNVLQQIVQTDGFPRLTAQFESQSMSGLYFSGFVAARDFGPYMGFLASCRFAARTVVDAIGARLDRARMRR